MHADLTGVFGEFLNVGQLDPEDDCNGRQEDDQRSRDGIEPGDETGSNEAFHNPYRKD